MYEANRPRGEYSDLEVSPTNQPPGSRNGLDHRFGHPRISPDTALRLARYLGSTPEFWMDLQTAYDLKVRPGQAAGDAIGAIEPRAA